MCSRHCNEHLIWPCRFNLPDFSLYILFYFSFNFQVTSQSVFACLCCSTFSGLSVLLPIPLHTPLLCPVAVTGGSWGLGVSTGQQLHKGVPQGLWHDDVSPLKHAICLPLITSHPCLSYSTGDSVSVSFELVQHHCVSDCIGQSSY